MSGEYHYVFLQFTPLRNKEATGCAVTSAHLL